MPEHITLFVYMLSCWKGDKCFHGSRQLAAAWDDGPFLLSASLS